MSIIFNTGLALTPCCSDQCASSGGYHGCGTLGKGSPYQYHTVGRGREERGERKRGGEEERGQKGRRLSAMITSYVSLIIVSKYLF